MCALVRNDVLFVSVCVYLDAESIKNCCHCEERSDVAIRTPCIRRMLGGHRPPHSPAPPNDHFPERFPLFTFPRFWCIVIPEQSRKPRVKCHRDGELPGGRRKFFAMRPPHPLLHMGIPPLCSNDTRSGKGSAVYLRHFPPVIHAFHSPVGLFRRGFLFAWAGSGSVPLPTDKGGHFL